MCIKTLAPLSVWAVTLRPVFCFLESLCGIRVQLPMVAAWCSETFDWRFPFPDSLSHFPQHLFPIYPYSHFLIYQVRNVSVINRLWRKKSPGNPRRNKRKRHCYFQVVMWERSFQPRLVPRETSQEGKVPRNDGQQATNSNKNYLFSFILHLESSLNLILPTALWDQC